MPAVRFATLAAILALSSAPAIADDRAPTADERTRIEAALTAAGYSSWEEIELDENDGWEIDDALHTDGQKYDLVLDPTSLAVKSRDD